MPPKSSTLASQRPFLLLGLTTALAAYALHHLRLTPATLLTLDAKLPGLIPSLALAPVVTWATYAAVGASRDAFKSRGFQGRDMLKPHSVEQVPECAGLPAAIAYTLLLFLFIPFKYASRSREPVGQTLEDGGWQGEIGGREGFPHHELSLYLSTLLSLLSSIMLGFLDDVFDIRWRLKLPIPLVASLPMLVVYHAGGGGTSVVVPGWPPAVRSLLGSVVDLGPLYYLFMSLLSTFSVHSINILAGINGVEVGQALVIAASLCINSALYLDTRAGEPGSWASRELRDRHLFSLSLLIPFCGCATGLLLWNRYPSRVFVGDTWCYFAGQVLACAGVLGHFSKTLLLFFIPQVFNFIFSCPQLFGIVPCPRHRLPFIHAPTGALYPSSAYLQNVPAKRLSALRRPILQLFSALHLVHLEYSSTNELVSTTNLTLLNALLVLRGVQPPRGAALAHAHRAEKRAGAEAEVAALRAPTGARVTELDLWRAMMGTQVGGSALAFMVRYWAAAIVFPQR